MSPPAWVSKSLCEILGLDSDTVNQVIVPDLEGYNTEVRLRGHLNDFLGSTPQARAFADRYVSHRFPNIQPPPPPPMADPRVDKQKAKAMRANLKPGKAGSGSAAASPFGSHTDLSSMSRGGSASGSGRGTLRSAGAITIVEKKSKKGKERAEAEKPGDKIWDLPKSKAVQRLEGIVQALQAVQDGGKGPAVDTPPCFCQARVHELSRYTPQCGQCGLVLCALQPAHATCPSCARASYSPPQLARLIKRVEGDVEAQLALEQEVREERERARREQALAASGGGAFPSLPGGPAPRAGGGGAGAGAHRVLTIGKGKRGRATATLRTTTKVAVAAPAPSGSSATEEAAPDTLPRPRSPPLDGKRVAKEWSKAVEWRAEHDRPWGDAKAERRGELWAYVPPTVVELLGEEGTGRRRRAKKAPRNVGADGRVVVGAAR